MVTREAVVFAYELLLGRAPENEEAVQSHMRACEGISQLSSAFLSSPEFLSRQDGVVLAHGINRLHSPEQEVEVVASPFAMARLFAHVESSWTDLGETEPYWSVLTQPRFYQETFSANSEAFYASGAGTVNRLLSDLHRNGIDSSSLHSCLEYGCGTGRVTGHLASAFGSVTACDISGAHISLAKRHLADVRNLEFIQLSSLASLVDLPSVDLFFSIIVLQHNPPPVIAAILHHLFRKLNPGGIAYFQVPTFGADYRFGIDEYLATLENRMEMHVLPQRHIFEIAHSAGCVPLEVTMDDCIGLPTWVSNTFIFRKTGT